MHEAERAATVVRALGHGRVPRVGLILGSGLGGIADRITEAVAIEYRELPGFPVSKVAGHAGRLIMGRWGGIGIACLQGRAHLYEGASAQALQVPVRTLKEIGCEIIVITNAAGALRRDLEPSNLMLISDHINMMGVNPLIGPNDERFGPRFPSMENAYDAALRVDLKRAAERAGVELSEGVYLALLGPNYETAAEVRAFARLGADAVGMSTVPEVIVARHCGLRVAGLSIISNLGAGLGGEEIGHDRVLQIVAKAAEQVARLLDAFLTELVGRR